MWDPALARQSDRSDELVFAIDIPQVIALETLERHALPAQSLHFENLELTPPIWPQTLPVEMPGGRRSGIIPSVVAVTRTLPAYRVFLVGEWLSLVEHLVRDQGVGGSNPLSPTNHFQ